jgi:hypothetical protein
LVLFLWRTLIDIEGFLLVKNGEFEARRQWFMPVILTTQEAEVRRIMFQSQPGQIVRETLSRKHPMQ